MLIFPPGRLHREGVKQALPPLGVSSLAAAVRDRCEVAIIDAVAEGFDRERPGTNGFFEYGLPIPVLEERIRSFAPDVVGISCLYSAVFPVVRELCEASKRAAPDALTVVGGTHPTYLPRECLESTPCLDMVAMGEGEPVLAGLLDALEAGIGLGAVPGLAFRDPASGEIRVTPPAPPIEDLDALPLPARDLLPWEAYQEIGTPHLLVMDRRRFATVLTSRGCPARCTFCSSAGFWGRRYRARSPGSVLDELEMLVRRYGVEEVHFEDDLVNFDKGRFRAILEGMISRGLNLRWSTPNGVALWRLDVDLIRLMKAAGCFEITLAIESGSQEVLDRIVRKPLKLHKVPPLVEEIRRQGIRTSAFFIVGFPGETLEQMRATFALPRKLGLDYAWFWIANPLPGTEIHRICVREGYLEPGFDFENNSFSKCNIHTPLWSAADVERLAHREFLKFNLQNVVRHPGEALRRYRTMLGNPRLVAQVARGLVHRGVRAFLPPAVCVAAERLKRRAQ